MFRSRSKNRSGILLGLLATTTVSMTGTVSAQSESVANNEIEEVIVTATKREQTLQEVPIAVSVTDSEVIEKAQINDIIDLQTVVPSLRVTQLQSSANTTFSIRGFGNGSNGSGIEPSVGVFIDGVYRSRSGSAISDLPNLERVEVLRGPQSTLFGKNASAGVISVVTAKPDQEFGGYVEGTLGNFGQKIAKGFVEGGLSDNLAASAGFTVNRRDGYFDNLLDGSESNNRDRWGFRAQALYTPTDNSEFRLIVDRDRIDEICCGTANVVTNPQLEPLINALADGNPMTPATVPEDAFAFADYNNVPPTNEVVNHGVSFHADIDFDNFALTSITSVRDANLKTDMDADFTAADIIGRNFLNLDIDTITQEVRLTSDSDGRLDWLVGAFYFDEQLDQNNGIFFGPAFRPYVDALTGNAVTAIEGILGFDEGNFHSNGDGVTEFTGQSNQALSVFGQLDFELTDNLIATVGLNHTRDEKEAYFRQVNTDVFSSFDLFTAGGGAVPAAFFAGAFFDTFAPILAPGLERTPANIALFAANVPVVQAIPDLGDGTSGAEAIAAIQAGVNAGITGIQGVQFLPPLIPLPNSVEDNTSDDSDTTYTLRLAYDVNDRLNLYGSVSTGFKATSWNLSRDSRPFLSSQGALEAANLTTVNQTYGTRFAGPEESTVIEAGLKTRFNRGALNVAVFDQNIKGFQSSIFTGTGFALRNAGKQSAFGVEFDLVYDITDALTLNAAGTFLDPKFDSFPGAAGLRTDDNPSGVVDLTGTKPVGIHEISSTAGLTYSWTLNNGWNAFARADYLYESNVRSNINTPESIQRQVNTLNGSLGFGSENGWDIRLWGRNLTDDQYVLSSFPRVIQAGNFNAYPNQPRTYGLTVRKSF